MTAAAEAAIANSDTRRWQILDARHHLHPFTDQAALAKRGVRVITRAEGIYLWDSDDNRLLDGMAGLWCVNVGYGRRELADAAFEAMNELPYYNSFFATTNPHAVELAQSLAPRMPGGCDRFFFANSGSEANDTAVKLIRYYWNLQGQKERKIIISRQRAYHGVTCAAASLSGLTPMHPQSDLPLEGFVHVDCPYHFEHGGGMSAADFGLQAARSLEEKILELGPDKVAAFIGEPVQGAGGVIIPPDSYWPEIQRICTKYDVLLHADEVICGFGRTGAWFGSDTFQITPDLVSIAKGLTSGYQPLSALAVGPRIGEALVNAGEEWVHGFTYSGHPVACAVARANLKILEDDALPARASGDIGDYFLKSLAALGDHPLVGETRGVGLLGAVELVADKGDNVRFPKEAEAGTVCRNHCFENGLVMRAIGDIMVACPPLVISREEIDDLFTLFRTCLDLTQRDLARTGR